MAKVVAFDLFEDLPKAKWYPDRQWLAHVRNGGDDLTAFVDDIYYQVEGEHYIDVDAQLHMFINAYSMSPGMITSTPGVGAITDRSQALRLTKSRWSQRATCFPFQRSVRAQLASHPRLAKRGTVDADRALMPGRSMICRGTLQHRDDAISTEGGGRPGSGPFAPAGIWAPERHFWFSLELGTNRRPIKNHAGQSAHEAQGSTRDLITAPKREKQVAVPKARPERTRHPTLWTVETVRWEFREHETEYQRLLAKKGEKGPGVQLGHRIAGADVEGREFAIAIAHHFLDRCAEEAVARMSLEIHIHPPEQDLQDESVYQVSDEVLEQAQQLGLEGDIEQQVKRMVRDATPYTHQSANLRHGRFILKVEGNAVVWLGSADPLRPPRKRK